MYICEATRHQHICLALDATQATRTVSKQRQVTNVNLFLVHNTLYLWVYIRKLLLSFARVSQFNLIIFTLFCVVAVTMLCVERNRDAITFEHKTERERRGRRRIRKKCFILRSLLTLFYSLRCLLRLYRYFLLFNWIYIKWIYFFCVSVSFLRQPQLFTVLLLNSIKKKKNGRHWWCFCWLHFNIKLFVRNRISCGNNKTK